MFNEVTSDRRFRRPTNTKLALATASLAALGAAYFAGKSKGAETVELFLKTAEGITALPQQ